MAKMRIYELARELVEKGLAKDSKTLNTDIINLLVKKGVEVKSHQSGVSDEDADYVRANNSKYNKDTHKSDTKAEKKPEVKAEEKPEKKGNKGILVVVLFLGIGGAGAYVYFTKIKGAKKPQNEYTDPDADYNEDEENLLDNIPDDVDEIIGEEVSEPDYSEDSEHEQEYDETEDE